ncbi:MAG: ATP-binding protein, partial [bacterium]
VLTTSREALAVSGEKLWPVDPLEFSQEDVDYAAPEAIETLLHVPAIKLFVERAQAVDPHFVLDHSTAAYVDEICRRLDGLPLAIELAASRARTIGVDQIANRLDQRFRLLKGSQRGTDLRHQTLRDTVHWSFELLTPEDQRLFSELSVFAGRFDLDAMEAVCGEDLDTDVIDLISRLVERSMVTVKRSEQALLNYELLDTMRVFGREQLSPEKNERLSDRHAQHYASMAARIEAGLKTDSETIVMQSTNTAFADFRAAHLHNIASMNVDQEMQLVSATREYAMRSMRYEVLSWADSAIELERAEKHALFPIVLGIQAYAAWVRGDFNQAMTLASRVSDEESARGLEPNGLAERVLANVLFVQGETDAGFVQTARQLELAEASGDLSRLTHACYMHSIAQSSEGDPEYAGELAQRAKEYGARSGSPTDVACGYAALGFHLHQDSDAALNAFSRAEDIANQAGNRWLRTFVRTEVCRLLLDRGDLDQARNSLAKVVDVWFRAGEWAQQWLTLTGCVVALHQLGNQELATLSIGAIEKRATLGALPVTASLREQAFDVAASLKKQLGEEQYLKLTAEGAELPVTEIVQRNRSALLS